jgi:phosphoribosylamine-glycine ligase
MHFSNIGIVGCGGREKAIGKKLKKDNKEVKLFYIGSHNNIGLDLINATYEIIDICNSELVLLNAFFKYRYSRMWR